jgi:hypothetical protein
VLGVVAIDLMAGPQFATAAVGGVEAITNQIGGRSSLRRSSPPRA